MTDDYDVIVVGGGASGLMAAGFAAKRGLSVLILDKNKRPARKVIITGKGRCNVTNNCEPDEFIKAVKTNGRFLYSCANTFTAHDTIAFFENLGVPLKTERGNRVFPVSDKSLDIVDALQRFIMKNGCQYRQAIVKRIIVENERAGGVILSDDTVINAKAVVIATGGISYPLTGSTGDGYKFAVQTGHTVIAPGPSLVPIVTKEKWATDLQGLSLKNVTLSVVDKENGKKIFYEQGELLFTHFGISGPLVLSASAHMKDVYDGRYKLIIDLKPALSKEMLDARLRRDFEKYKNKDFSNALRDLLPARMIETVVLLSGIAPQLKINQITKEMRAKTVALLKGLELTFKSFRPVDEAIITSGGVNVTEINPKTMESKKISELYFAGEVLDVDAYTGGYNLQIAFSTGYVCGSSVLSKETY